MKRGAWSPRYRPFASGWVYPNSREILEEAFFGAAEEETTDRTGFGPFSRLALSGVSQRLYGSFAGKTEDTPAPDEIDVTDTWSVALTESVAILGTIAVTDTLSVEADDTSSLDTPFNAASVTDTLSVSLTESVEMFKAFAVTDTLSVSLTESVALLENEAKAATDTWSVAVTDSAEVAEVDATQPEPERATGGYGWANQYNASRQRKRKRDEDDEEDPPPPVAQDATPPDTSRDLELTRQLVAYWSGEADREMLNRRAQRALDYALRAESVLAMQLFERELARQMEEEEMALLLTLLND